MRTPENDESSSEGAGSLADGFGTVVGSDDDINFGDGSGDGTAALQDDASDPSGSVRSGDDPAGDAGRDTDLDLDLNGDGLVDALDFHTAVTGFFDGGSGDDPGHGEAAHDGHEGPDGAGHADDAVGGPQDDGGAGLFGF